MTCGGDVLARLFVAGFEWQIQAASVRMVEHFRTPVAAARGLPYARSTKARSRSIAASHCAEI